MKERNIYEFVHLSVQRQPELGFIDEDEVRQLSQAIDDLVADNLLVRQAGTNAGTPNVAAENFNTVVVLPLRGDFRQWVQDHGGLLDRLFLPDRDFEALRGRYNDARTAWTTKFSRTLPGATIPAGGPAPPPKTKSGNLGMGFILAAIAVAYAASKVRK